MAVLQTLAFLEGLSKYVVGIQTAWVIMKSDDVTITRAYDQVKACISSYRHKLDVQFIVQDGGLGRTYLDVLERRSNATHMVLGVDELMLLSHFDLVAAVRDARLDCDSQQVPLTRV